MNDANAVVPATTVRRTVIALSIVAAVVIAVLVIFRIDISPMREFRRDVLYRDAFMRGSEPQIGFADPSPMTIWLPLDFFLWDSLRSGHLPLWERMQGGGYSPLVTLQTGLLHPVRWIGALFPRRAMPSVMIVVTLYIATVGFYLFAIVFGFRQSAALAGMLIFATSSALLSHLHYSGGFLPLAHLPWIAFFYRRLLDTPTRGRFAALALILGSMFLAGHPLIIVSVSLGCGSLAIVDAIARRSVRPPLLLFGAAIIGLLVAAVGLMPGIANAPYSWSYKTASEYGQAYRPDFFSTWLQVNEVIAVDRFGGTCCSDTRPYYLFVGPFTLLLAGCGMVASLRMKAMRLVLVALPLFWYLLLVPGPWMLPIRSLGPLVYLQPWYYSGIFGFFIALAAAAGFAWLFAQKTSTFRAIALLFVAGTVALNASRDRFLFQPLVDVDIIRGPAVDALRKAAAGSRVTAYLGHVHRMNSARLTGIEDVRLTAPIFYERYRLWWWLVDPNIDKQSHPTAPTTDVLASPLVADFNVAFVLQSRAAREGWFNSVWRGRRDTDLSPRLVPPQFRLFGRSSSLDVRAIAGVKPRASFAERVLIVPDLDAAVRALHDRPDLARHASVVESRDPLRLPPSMRGTVQVRYPADSRVELDVDSDAGGLVVLRDTFAPGWRATIDDIETDIFAVNVLSRGVIVPPGRHRIAMRYTPPGLMSGVAISAIAILGLLLFVRKKK